MSNSDRASSGDGKLWTAEELLAMSPNDRHETVQACLVTDLAAVPSGLLERARADILADIAKTEAAQSVVE